MEAARSEGATPLYIAAQNGHKDGTAIFLLRD